MGKPILVDFKTGKKIKPDSFDYEKDIQKFVENNMEQIFNIKFIESEVSFNDINDGNGRIDSIGIDENNRPVIIEYKLNDRHNAIVQAMYYTEWLKSNKEKIEKMISKKYGEKMSEMIEWKPRIICIANKFDKYWIELLRKNNNFFGDITLVKYYLYGNSSIVGFEYLNNFNESNKLLNCNKNEYTKDNINAIDGYNQSEFILKYNKLDSKTKELVNYISSEIENISNDISITILKHYKAFSKIRNFVCMVIKKEKIILYLQLDYSDDMKFFENIEDYSKKGHLGTGDVKISIRSKKEFEDIFKYIEKSYQEN